MNLKSAERTIKRVLNNIDVKSHRRYRSLMLNRSITGIDEQSHDGRAVVINYKSEYWHYDRGRYAYLLFIALKRAGFKVYLSNNFSFLSRLTKYKELLLAEDFGIVSNLPFDRDALWFPFTKQTIIIVNLGTRSKNKSLGENYLPFPYMMHPQIYANEIDLGLIDLRQNEKVGRIIFAGNVNKKQYSSGRVDSYFGKVPRYELLSFLESTLMQNELRIINKDKEVLSSDGFSNALTIARSEAVFIPFVEWLPGLSRFDFFLACPGAHMPMCHNVIEAMAVGVIPILEYPEYFHPSLTPGVNCITFEGTENVHTKIREVLNFSESKIDELRKGVIEYYDRFLAPESWVSRMKTQSIHTEGNLSFNSWAVNDSIIS
ncbi:MULTISPECIES: hypothetical protein [unclassified Imperialibacter]|uniref:hypothetical protein n=1 Tax=unclassified Imperialibacter TaxID=2629706 RepID=UPI001254DEE0|nr:MULTISPECIES: hypothetical protein [unclassified Imperialibacter]CAD5277425.1 hypothetical protein IMPERIA89_440009 [Imperialibacter sp. 89]CAD5299457.1 hypothetical protein IMPERIA75_80009 [Imperialibacter sp. 75]VVT27457.1 hypothetical protein IMPR6_420009 [Imperialibacter sp. EC-SDR9]